MVESALIIMAKAPEPGEVKTRLCPPLSLNSAAEFYSCLLKDKISQALSVPDADVFVSLPESVGEERSTEVSCGCCCITQRGPDLGARLACCAAEAFEKGYTRVLLVDSDSPTLPPIFFQNAFESLASNPDSVVLGPTSDGGYYLVGMARLYSVLFQDIPWSTPEVLKLTLKRASRDRIRVELLPEWYDIDIGEDLVRLIEDLADPEVVSLAPATAAWLMGWKGREVLSIEHTVESVSNYPRSE